MFAENFKEKVLNNYYGDTVFNFSKRCYFRNIFACLPTGFPACIHAYLSALTVLLCCFFQMYYQRN